MTVVDGVTADDVAREDIVPLAVGFDVGEPIWPQRSDHEYPACVQHEALINHAFTRRHVTILCPYDAQRLDPVVLSDGARTRPLLVDAAREHRSDVYVPDKVIAAYNRDLDAPVDATTIAVDGSGLAGLRRVAAELAARLGLTGSVVTMWCWC